MTIIKILFDVFIGFINAHVSYFSFGFRLSLFIYEPFLTWKKCGTFLSYSPSSLSQVPVLVDIGLFTPNTPFPRASGSSKTDLYNLTNSWQSKSKHFFSFFFLC